MTWEEGEEEEGENRERVASVSACACGCRRWRCRWSGLVGCEKVGASARERERENANVNEVEERRRERAAEVIERNAREARDRGQGGRKRREWCEMRTRMKEKIVHEGERAW